MNNLDTLDLALKNAMLHLKAAHSIAKHLDIDTSSPMDSEDLFELEDTLLTLSAIEDESAHVHDAVLQHLDAGNPGYIRSVQSDLDEIEATHIDRVRTFIHDGELRTHLARRLSQLWSAGTRAKEEVAGEMADATGDAASAPSEHDGTFRKGHVSDA